MSGVLQLSNNDLVILRDVASQYYLQAGQDSDPMTAVAKLISGNIGGLLQPSLYFQVHSTPIQGFWTITTVATNKFLKVDTSATGNQSKLTWVDTNPSSDFVMDKSPFYFSFTQVAGTDSPVLYVLGSYYQGGLTLQQPDGAGTDPSFAMPQAIPGSIPEISFEVTVANEAPSSLALNAMDLVSPVNLGGAGVGSSSASSAGTTKVDGWAVAFIILIAVLALIALGYGIYMLYRYYTRGETKKRRMIVSPAPNTVVVEGSSSPSSTTITSTPSTNVTPGTTTVSTTASTPPGTAPAVPAVPPSSGGGGGGGAVHYNRFYQDPAYRYGGANTIPVNSSLMMRIPASTVQAQSGQGSFGMIYDYES